MCDRSGDLVGEMQWGRADPAQQCGYRIHKQSEFLGARHVIQMPKIVVCGPDTVIQFSDPYDQVSADGIKDNLPHHFRFDALIVFRLGTESELCWPAGDSHSEQLCLAEDS